jgi:hypothetical protein
LVWFVGEFFWAVLGVLQVKVNVRKKRERKGESWQVLGVLQLIEEEKKCEEEREMIIKKINKFLKNNNLIENNLN